uniref:ShKT domain-containing protein n=1 Tax=Panagrolaimus superbus TaxID=310955 RepID=A0A914YKD3_9BILA
MARRLTQELLKKQLLRLQALKTIKETIRERMLSTSSSPLPFATIYHAPRFLTAAAATKSSPLSTQLFTATVSPFTKTTTIMQIPPLIVSRNKSKSVSSSSSSPSSSSNPLHFQPSTITCVDKKYSCTFWIKADKHVCDNQQRFMRINCAKSCKFCEI